MIILVGPVCAGKTTLADRLQVSLKATILRAREVIERSSVGADRAQLQSAGLDLEESTHGRWLAESVRSLRDKTVIVDSARTEAQVASLREVENRDSRTIFLDVSEAVCRRRFESRVDPADHSRSLDEVLAGELPFPVRLRRQADLVIETDQLTPIEVCRIALDWLSLSRGKSPQ